MPVCYTNLRFRQNHRSLQRNVSLSTAIAHVAVQWLFASAAALLRCFLFNANKLSADYARRPIDGGTNGMP